MADIKNFGLKGVNADLQLGKSGGRVKFDGTDKFNFVLADGTTGANVAFNKATADNFVFSNTSSVALTGAITDLSTSASDESVATSLAIKTYVDDSITAQDLDFAGDSGTGAIDLDSQSLTIAGGTNLTSVASGQTATIELDADISLDSVTTTANVDVGGALAVTGTSAFTGDMTAGNITLTGDLVSASGAGGTITGAALVSANALVATDSLTIAGFEVDGIIDDDTMGTASNTTMATSESIKAYVDSAVTAADLDFAGDTGTGAVDLDSQVLTITGSTGIETSGSGQTMTVTMSDTTVTAGTYGDATNIPQFTVDQQGRITGSSNVAIQTSWTLAGDSGSEVVEGGDTATIAGGTNITTVASATDTLTVNLDGNISLTSVSATDDVSAGNFVVADNGSLRNASGTATLTMTAAGNMVANVDTDFELNSDDDVTFEIADKFTARTGNYIDLNAGDEVYIQSRNDKIELHSANQAEGIQLDIDDSNITDPVVHVYGSNDGNNIGLFKINTSTPISAILDEDDMASNSDSAVATQQSVKAYVDASVTAADLDFAGDTGAGNVDLDSQTLTIAGGTNLTSVASGQTATISLDSDISVTSVTATGNVDAADIYLTGDLVSGGGSGGTITGAALVSADAYEMTDDGNIHNVSRTAKISMTARGDIYANSTFDFNVTATDDMNLTVGDSFYLESQDEAVIESKTSFAQVKAEEQIYIESTTGLVEIASGADQTAGVQLYVDYNNIADPVVHIYGSNDGNDTGLFKINTSTPVSAILDEDDFASDSDSALATQQSIKAFVESSVTAADLDFAGDTGTGAVNLDSQAMTIAGGTNLTSVASGQTITVALDDNVNLAGNLTVGGTFNSDDITASQVTVDGDAVITGNLTVQGTQTIVDSTVVDIKDAVIRVNSDGSTVSAGLEANVAGVIKQFVYNPVTSVWEADDGLKSTSVEFGTLTDGTVSVTDFVTEADGIANNDSDSTVPTSAAVIDYVENNGGDGLALRAAFTANSSDATFDMGTMPNVSSRTYYGATVRIQVTSAFSGDSFDHILVKENGGAGTVLVAETDADASANGVYVVELSGSDTLTKNASVQVQFMQADGVTPAVVTAGAMAATVSYHYTG
jgi:hypothetical protein